VATWTRVPGGYVAKFRVASESALGIRAKLVIGTVPGAFEVRVQGSDLGRIESMTIEPTLGNEHWTPWTEGSAQVIELFSPVEPSAGAVAIEAVVHFTDSPLATTKAAGTCTVSTMCSTDDPTLDAAILERKKSIAKMIFNDNGSAFLCTGTLLNTDRFPTPFFLSANHCISNAAAASTLTTIWFYEATACGSTASNGASAQIAGGAQLTFTNYDVDETLLRLNVSPPAGVVYSAWNRAAVANGTPFVSLSHPKGDTARLALGTVGNELRIADRPQDMYGVSFTRGIIQGGSSGSGLFVLNGSSLELRGVLSGTTIRNSPDGLSCTDLDEQGIYSRFEIFEPEIDAYLHTATPAGDDAPNRALDLFNAPITDPNGVDKPLDLRGSALVLAGKKIDYAGDVDVFRFRLTQQSSVHAWSTGTLDTVGAILDSNGVNLEANDDEDVSSGHTNFNFGITRSLPPGTYYVQVTHFDAAGTGTYTLNLNATASAANFTDLWWNAQEPGWGLNLNHQGSVMFGTLFTYDAGGAAMWLVMSRGDLQADGSYSGTLYRTTGPAFNAVPFGPTTNTSVGTMRVSFANSASGTLTYSFNGTGVTKSITRQVFSSQPSCTFTTGDRSTATNYQDLWWNPNEPGWGVNVTHQGNIIFATLFTYDASGQGKWFVLPNGAKTGTGAYAGTLYATTGPAFNAPWVADQPSAVGTMSFSFASGNAGTLAYSVNGVTVTKAIQRETFSSPTTQCQ
jgi:lysyl endopeptidase